MAKNKVILTKTVLENTFLMTLTNSVS